MVRTLFHTLGKEVRGIHEAAYLLGAFTIGSQVLALVRDRLLAGTFGAGEMLDIYYAAFRVPDLLFAAIASLVSFSVLIPFLAAHTRDADGAPREFLSSVFSFFMLIMVVVAVLAFWSAPVLANALFPDITGAAHETLTLLMRIMLLQPIFLGASNLLASVTQLQGKFIIYALSPLLYNAGIIVGILLFYPLFGLAGLAWGVVLGAVLHLSIQLPFIITAGMLPRLQIPQISIVRRVTLTSLPRTLALSAQQLTLLVLVSMAAALYPGAITVFTLAFNLYTVPLAIVGASYSVAAFPTLARVFAGGNGESFLQHVSAAARHILVLTLPIFALIIVLRAHIVRVILGSGHFSWDDTRLTAAALALFCFGLVAHALIMLLVRAYYAAGRTLIPFAVNAIGAAVTIIGAIALSRIFSAESFLRLFFEDLLRVGGVPGTDVLALPLAYALGMLATAAILGIIFALEFPAREYGFTRTFFEASAAAIVCGFIAHEILDLFDEVVNLTTFWGVFAQGALAGIAGLAAAAVTLVLIGNSEIREAYTSAHHRFWRKHPVASDDIDM